MKPIYSYRDFRQWLRDFYAREKRASPGFTHASFARRAGLKSPNYLKLVMDGHRRLTTARIQAFAGALGLEAGELDYFEALVLENQAESAAERKYYARRLSALRGYSTRGGRGVARARPTELLESSLRVAILLCSSRKPLDQAAEHAARELGLPKAKAMEAIQSLLDRKALVLDSGGALRLPDPHVMMSDPKGLSDRQKRFLREGLEEAQAVFRARYPTGAAKFLSILLTAAPGSLPAIFQDLRGAAEKAASDFDPEEGVESGVYRIQVQAYRVGKNLD